MKISQTYKDVLASFDTVKNDVIDFTFRSITILIGPLYAYGLYVETDWVSWSFISNALILTYLTLFTLFRIRLSLNIKKYILLFVLINGNLYTIYNLGFFGGAQYFMILLICVTLFYFKRWVAYVVIIGVVLYYFLFMYLYTNGIIEYHAPVEYLVNNKAVWISDFNLTVLTSIVVGYALIKTFNAYADKEKERQESQKKLNYTISNLPIPVAALTEDERIPYFNDKFHEYFGYDADEIPTFNHWLKKAYPDEQTRNRIRGIDQIRMREGFKTQKQLPLEYYDFTTKNGDVKSAEVHHMFFGETAICAFIDITERRKKRRLMMETMMQAEEKEKLRIAQELHDGIGPLLSTAKIYAHTLMLKINNAEKSGMGEKLKELLDSSIKELRNVINNVSPQILQQYGLVKALESFIGHIQPLASAEIKLKAKPVKIENALNELAIFRALIELINNSMKYAEASMININIENNKEGIQVLYKDNGVGFDFDKERTKGFGLSNIMNRIETVGGFFSLKTNPGEGVEVRIEFEEQ
ncbi:MAG: histidine kinase [Bacteroidales bacterium]|nr:histidine kinase [Bacteroidales bacterium]